MTQRNRTKPDSQPSTQSEQQDAPSRAIPAMPAGTPPPHPPLDTPRFRLIQQLLPASATGLFSSGPIDTSPGSASAVRLPSAGMLNPHKILGISPP